MARARYRTPSLSNTPYQMSMTNDPWFNLGSLIGTAWADNYNQRGIKKGMNEAEGVANQMFNGTNGMDGITVPAVAQGQQAPDNLYQLGSLAGAISPNSITANSVKNGAIGQQQQPTPQISDLYANSYTPFGDFSVNNFLKKKGYINPERNLKAEKLDYFNQKYNSGTPNPDGDANTIQSTVNNVNSALGGLENQDVKKMVSSLPYTNLDINTLQGAIRKQLIKSGRTDYQISKILENINPTLEGKLNQYNQMQVGQLREQLDNQIKAGEIDNAMVTLSQIGKLNPEMAKALGYKMKRAQDRDFDNYSIEQKIQNFIKGGATRQEAENLARWGNLGGIQGAREAYNAKRMALLNGGGNGGRSGGGRSSGDGGERSGRGDGKNSPKKIDTTRAESIKKRYEEGDPTIDKRTYNAAIAKIKAADEQDVADHLEPTLEQVYDKVWDMYNEEGIPVDELRPVIANMLPPDQAFEVNRRLIEATTPRPVMSEDLKGYNTQRQSNKAEESESKGMFADQAYKQRPNSLATAEDVDEAGRLFFPGWDNVFNPK